MHWPPKLILLSGAAGWLGSRLLEGLIRGLPDPDACPALPAGTRVRALVVPGDQTPILRRWGERVEVCTGDLRQPADCARFCDGAREAVLFHTAGLIHPRRVADFYAVNVTGTTHLLDAAIAAGVRRAVVVSSNSPCGCNPHPDHLFDEQSPSRPYLNYGRSKMLMEQAVQARRNAIETVIIRAPWFYGPNQPPRQTLFFQMIRRGTVPIVGGGQNLRSMAYVDNLCQGLVRAAAVEAAAGRLYWIADRRPYSMNEIVDTVERLLEGEFGRPCAHRRLRLPGLASQVAWLADAALQTLGLYAPKLHVLSEMNKTIACSVGLAERELGYAPRVELEEGMRRSLRWCIEQGLPI